MSAWKILVSGGVFNVLMMILPFIAIVESTHNMQNNISI
jgi:hypothetical protein